MSSPSLLNIFDGKMLIRTCLLSLYMTTPFFFSSSFSPLEIPAGWVQLSFELGFRRIRSDGTWEKGIRWGFNAGSRYMMMLQHRTTSVLHVYTPHSWRSLTLTVGRGKAAHLPRPLPLAMVTSNSRSKSLFLANIARNSLISLEPVLVQHTRRAPQSHPYGMDLNAHVEECTRCVAVSVNLHVTVYTSPTASTVERLGFARPLRSFHDSAMKGIT
eukprot:283195-Pyramimonas_sp.AAC.3